MQDQSAVAMVVDIGTAVLAVAHVSEAPLVEPHGTYIPAKSGTFVNHDLFLYKWWSQRRHT